VPAGPVSPRKYGGTDSGGTRPATVALITGPAVLPGPSGGLLTGPAPVQLKPAAVQLPAMPASAVAASAAAAARAGPRTPFMPGGRRDHREALHA
jgi:hypothetical protein